MILRYPGGAVIERQVHHCEKGVEGWEVIHRCIVLMVMSSSKVLYIDLHMPIPSYVVSI